MLNGLKELNRFEVLVPERTCCGKFACILVRQQGRPLRVYGTAVDYVAGEPMRPKRVRVQRGCPELHGAVLMPHEYEFCWWADEEED